VAGLSRCVVFWVAWIEENSWVLLDPFSQQVERPASYGFPNRGKGIKLENPSESNWIKIR
jgi:hypothetical protein